LPRTKQRLDKKSLKQDELLNLTARAADYMSANANVVLGIAAAVVVAIVLVVFWARGQAQKAREADVRFAQVIAAFSAGQSEPAAQIAITMQSEFAGSRAAILATYIAGRCQLQLGKFPEAEESFRKYIASASKAPFYAQAATRGLAAAVEAQGRAAEAAALYQEAAAALPEPLASEARLDAARALRVAGSLDQAKDLLESIVAQNTDLTSQARIELALLSSARGVAPPATAPAPAP